MQVLLNESLIPEEVEIKREGKNAEKLKTKIKKDRPKCKETANKNQRLVNIAFVAGA